MIGILGGTFDPVHYGHLRPALELWEQLDLKELRFIPAGQPSHRDAPLASDKQRLHMTQLAVRGQAGFVVDDREIRRRKVAYTTDTLYELRGELGASVPICLIMGSDAFAELASWHRWWELPQLAHIVVAQRPNGDLPEQGEVADLMEQDRTDDLGALHGSAGGRVLVAPVSQLNIAATSIRSLVAAGRSPRYLLPDSVWDYIQQQGLYQTREVKAV